MTSLRGSGGRSFFEKITWVLAALFILGALGISLFKSKERLSSSLSGFKSKKASLPVNAQNVPADASDDK